MIWKSEKNLLYLRILLTKGSRLGHLYYHYARYLKSNNCFLMKDVFHQDPYDLFPPPPMFVFHRLYPENLIAGI